MTIADFMNDTRRVRFRISLFNRSTGKSKTIGDDEIIKLEILRETGVGIFAAGEARVELDNTGRKYDCTYSGSVLYGVYDNADYNTVRAVFEVGLQDEDGVTWFQLANFQRIYYDGGDIQGTSISLIFRDDVEIFDNITIAEGGYIARNMAGEHTGEEFIDLLAPGYVVWADDEYDEDGNIVSYSPMRTYSRPYMQLVGASYRELLRLFAFDAKGFVWVDGKRNIVFSECKKGKFADRYAVATLTRDDCEEMPMMRYITPYQGAKITDGQGNIRSAGDAPFISASNPLYGSVDASRCKWFLNVANLPTFSFASRGTPAWDIGNVVKVPTVDGGSINLMITKKKYIYDGSFREEAEGIAWQN